MAFELPKLTYSFDGLEPVIDAATMEIHHDRHHGGYVKKLNAALERHDEFLEMEVEELMGKLDDVPAEIRTAVRNNGGGHANHSLFWTVMSADGGGEPEGPVAKEIDDVFGGTEALKEEFNQAALSQFGSGWAWLVVEGGKLHVCSTPNQDNPWMKGNVPILGLDVWEHAYYLKYKNMRAEYVENFWKIVNWEEVGRRFEEAVK